jgi:hypothetical protein
VPESVRVELIVIELTSDVTPQQAADLASSLAKEVAPQFPDFIQAVRVQKVRTETWTEKVY